MRQITDNNRLSRPCGCRILNNCSGTLDASWAEINTIHGYQANPYFFVGAGVGFHYFPKYSSNKIDGVPLWKRDASCEIPLFFNMRWTILNKRITPFVDARFGHYVTNHSGIYATGGIGCRLSMKKNQALYVTASYAATKIRYKESNLMPARYAYYWYYENTDEDQSAVSLKIGYEF